MATSEVEKRTSHAVDPHDEPSAEWGWHGTFPKGIQAAGWFCTIAMVAMLIGNHEGKTEDLWLIGIALIMAVGLIWDLRRRRVSWRR